MSDFPRIVKPDADKNAYVYWLEAGSYSHAAESPEAFQFLPGTREDFEQADKEALTASPYELFMTRDYYGNISGYVMRKDIIAWVDASGDNCEDTPESDAFIIPSDHPALLIDNTNIYSHIGDGYDLAHVAEVEAFYTEFILPETHQKRIYGYQAILEDLGIMIRQHLSDTDWLGWASMFYHLDFLWELYGGHRYSRQWGKVSMEPHIIALSELVGDLDWKQVYRILDVLQNADNAFDPLLGDPRLFVQIKEYVTAFGWGRVASLLPLITNDEASVELLYAALENNIDYDLIQAAAAAAAAA